jgi:hypothetical protein
VRKIGGGMKKKKKRKKDKKQKKTKHMILWDRTLMRGREWIGLREDEIFEGVVSIKMLLKKAKFGIVLHQ